MQPGGDLNFLHQKVLEYSNYKEKILEVNLIVIRPMLVIVNCLNLTLYITKVTKV